MLRFLFNTKFKDISTGSRFLKKKILNKLKLNSNSPFIGAELAILSQLKGYKVNEIPIETYPRTFGSGSSVGIRNIILTIYDMFLFFLKVKLQKTNEK